MRKCRWLFARTATFERVHLEEKSVVKFAVKQKLPDMTALCDEWQHLTFWLKLLRRIDDTYIDGKLVRSTIPEILHTLHAL